MRRIGVDTGGTFTDGILWDDEIGLVESAKTSSVRADPSKAVIAVTEKLGGLTCSVRHLVHGTTVATNAALEQSGDRTALLTTKGFRDVIEIARLSRSPEELYDLKAKNQPCLVKRRDRFEVGERVDHLGSVIEALDEQDIRAAAESIRKRSIKSVAVCFLHAYANGENERAAKRILERELPDVAVSISSEVFPEFREYERTTTTALNAYLIPIVEGYLQRLQSRVDMTETGARLWIMQSNGGVVAAETASRLPVTLLLSGPSGGVVAANYLLEQSGELNGITLDMGGTSYDVSILADRKVPVTSERNVMSMPVKAPSIDILTIGAGGGSVGWADAAGQFRVGPRSAGADPGPACYGRGGGEPTVTDANLVLGILGDGQVLGGEVQLDERAAHLACERLGVRLGLSGLETAWGIRRLANAAMAGATRAVSVGRGFDPRDFPLIAFGGAGPMHAADIAAELDSPKVIVPPVPGCFCALGLVVSDITHDYVATYLAIVTEAVEAELDARLAGLMRGATSDLNDEGVELHRQEFTVSLDLRYAGEQASVSVPVLKTGSGWLRHTRLAFDQAHEKLYGFMVPDEPVEVVNIRLRALGRLRAAALGRSVEPMKRHRIEPFAERSVALSAERGERHRVPIFRREDIRPGGTFEGPAIVEQADTTIAIPPGVRVRADKNCNLHMERG